MDLRLLNYFLVVAREENITKAAAQLHITQPTLSRQLRQLEEALEVKLFERSSHNIILTREGIMLRRRAQELVSLAERTKRELIGNDEIISGEITIGGGEFRSSDCLARMISDFMKEQEQITFELYSGNNDNVIEQMDKGLIDIGLFIAPIDLAKYESVRMHQKERWGVLVRKDSPLAERQEIRREDFLGLKIIAPKRLATNSELQQWFAEIYQQLDIKVSYNLLYNAAAMVEQGLDGALCLELNTNYDDLTFLPLVPKVEHSSVLAWRKNQVISPAVAAFIKYLKEVNEKDE
jgi:DNA-binding transcriptional LysR family regulator